MPRRVTAQAPATPPSRCQTAAPFLRNPYGPFAGLRLDMGSQKPSPRGKRRAAAPHPRTRTSRSRDRRLANSSATRRAQGSIASLRSPQSSASRAALSSMSQRVTIALANLGPSILGEEKPALGSTRDGATEACGCEILGLCDPPRPRDKNHLTIDHLSPRLIALLARSVDSLPTSLTAGKNVAGFAPIGAAVGGASLVDPSDRGPEKGAALSRSCPKRVD